MQRSNKKGRGIHRLFLRKRSTQPAEKEKLKLPFSRIVSNNWFILKIAFSASPWFTIHRLSAMMINRLIVFVEHVYMVGYIIDSIMNNEPFYKPALFIGIVFVTLVAYTFYDDGINASIAQTGFQKMKQKLRLRIYQKAVKIDLKCYDDPDFFNDFVWAMNEAAPQLERVLYDTSLLLGFTAGALVAMGYILSQDIVGLIAVAVSFTGTMFCNKILSKRWVRTREINRPEERRRDYISRVFYLPEHVSELRMNNIKQKLYDSFRAAYLSIRQVIDKRSRLNVLVYMGFFLFGFIPIEGVYLVHLLYNAIVAKTIGYGAMITLYNSCNNVTSSFRRVADILPKMLENSLYIEKIRHFLEYPIKIQSPRLPAPMPKTPGDLVLDHLQFGYNEKPVLHDICLTIKKGEKIALVGHNGAGKSTLVKLIMRLYDPTGGQICYGGTDIRQFDLQQYRRAFETVFQDYQIFALTVEQNITMTTEPVDTQRLQQAIDAGGFRETLNTLPDGLQTQLTREFDEHGVTLSGGQAQALVTARAFYANADILILDEPSSALDPIAEYNLNKSVMEQAKDKTVITISHRLSTTRLADRIYLLEHGRIIESGTHDQLMQQQGKYAQMFTLQAQKYQY